MFQKPSSAFSVSQLSTILKQCFENPAFKGISVYGEVYSIKPGRFTYIDLGDQGIKETNSPLLKVARSYYYTSDVPLNEVKIGDVVCVKGDLSYYPHGSSLTFWAKELTRVQSQSGKSLLKKQETLKKLDKLGYLKEERKLPIPRFCQSVAIITAKEGAAYQDRLKTLHRRFPVSTMLFPSIVQGENAAKSRVKALEKAKKGNFDVILLGRGGGSKTDLSCFDDETLALSIATSKIPVITCIGHTIDVAIADRVSSKQAITPTEGASLINPSRDEIQQERQSFEENLSNRFTQVLRSYARRNESYRSRLSALSPSNRIKEKKNNWKRSFLARQQAFAKTLKAKEIANQRYASSLYKDFSAMLRKKRTELENFNLILSLYDPSQIKDKGYAIVLRNGKKITSAKQLVSGDRIEITYPDGNKKAVVKD